MQDITEEQMEIILEVMSALSSSFTFDVYDEDDISQEIFLICVDLLDSYNESKGTLFSFLYGATPKKLISLKRCKYFNPHSQSSDKRLALLHAGSIYDEDLIDYEIDNVIFEYDEYVDRNIPSDLREDYIKLKEGITISSSAKNKILEYVSIISKQLRQKIEELPTGVV